MDNYRKTVLGLTCVRFQWRPILFAALLVLSIAPVFLFRFLPFSDYPQWVFQGYLLRRVHEDPGAVYRYYTLTHAPVPNSAFSTVAWMLSYIIRSPEVVAKVFLGLATVMFVTGAAYLIRSVRRHPTAMEFLPFVWAYGYYVYNGFLSYHFSSGLCLLTIGYLHRVTGGGSRAPCSGVHTWS